MLLIALVLAHAKLGGAPCACRFQEHPEQRSSDAAAAATVSISGLCSLPPPRFPGRGFAHADGASANGQGTYRSLRFRQRFGAPIACQPGANCYCAAPSSSAAPRRAGHPGQRPAGFLAREAAHHLIRIQAVRSRCAVGAASLTPKLRPFNSCCTRCTVSRIDRDSGSCPRAFHPDRAGKVAQIDSSFGASSRAS